jgi:hypothetical protein
MEIMGRIIIDLPAYEVVPLKSVGPVHLGMTRHEARSAMNSPFESYLKSLDDISLADAFHESCFQVFYDENDRVEYIELSKGGVKALYKGISVFEEEAVEVLGMVHQDAAYDGNDPEVGYGYIFPALEMSLGRMCRPEDDINESRYICTIGIGKQGYYSR